MSKPATRQSRPSSAARADGAILRQLTTRIGADPKLKVGPVLKSLGVTDPADVRRLRAAFEERRDEVASAPAPRRRAAASEPATAERAMALAGPRSATKRAAPRKAAAGSKAKAEPVIKAEEAPARVDAAAAPTTTREEPTVHATGTERVGLTMLPADMLAASISLGVRALASGFNTQAAFYASLMRTPPVALMMRQQIAVTEAAIGVLSHNASSGRRTARSR